MTRHAPPQSQPARWAGFLLSVLVAASGCSSSDRACAANADCFQGEVCFGGFCEVPSNNLVQTNNTTNNRENNANNTSNATNNVSNNATNNVSNNATNNVSNNATNNVSNNATNNVSNATNNSSNTPNPTCIIDPFGNMCVEDDYEENDGYDGGTSSSNWDETPWESNSWCEGPNLPETTRTLSGTLCAGDRGDAFRFVVANNGPMCITGDRVTFRMFVEVVTPCDPTLFRVEPYTFGLDPIRNDLCADDPDVRCTVSNGGQNHQIEWIWDGQQIFDPRIQIMADDPNLQFDYNITFEIIDQ